MKIYTRTGDDGTTGLFGADRVKKTHVRVEAYGTVDELNAIIGQVRAQLDLLNHKTLIDPVLVEIQEHLFVLGGDLASPEPTTFPVPRIRKSEIDKIEFLIDRFQDDLPKLKKFILPSGIQPAATLHFARTVCRRAERITITAREKDASISTETVKYLNRLSDLLFVLARWVNHLAGVTETEWSPS